MQRFEKRCKENDRRESQGKSIKRKKKSPEEKQAIASASRFVLGEAHKKDSDDDESDESSVDYDDCGIDINQYDEQSKEDSSEAEFDSDVNDFIASEDDVNDLDSESDSSECISDCDEKIKPIARKRIIEDSSDEDDSVVQTRKKPKKSESKETKKSTKKEQSTKAKTTKKKKKKKPTKQPMTEPTTEPLPQQQRPINQPTTRPQQPTMNIATIKQIQKRSMYQRINHAMVVYNIHLANRSDEKWVDNLKATADYYVDYGYQQIRRCNRDPAVEEWATNQRSAIAGGSIDQWKLLLLQVIQFL